VFLFSPGGREACPPGLSRRSSGSGGGRLQEGVGPVGEPYAQP